MSVLKMTAAHRHFRRVVDPVLRVWLQHPGSGSQQMGSGLQRCGSGRQLGNLQTVSGRQHVGLGRHEFPMHTGSGLQQSGSGRHLKMFGGQQVCFANWEIRAECVFEWQGSTADTAADNAAVSIAVPAMTGKMRRIIVPTPKRGSR
jgi:hypothetical protein